MLHFIKQFNYTSITHTPICVIGGGTGGLNFVGQIQREKSVFRHDIRVFQPNQIHYYQPAFTMIGGNICKPEEVHRPTRSLYDSAINLTELQINKVIPESNKLITQDGREWSYDQLIISTGNVLNFKDIKGAQEALDDPDCPVGSIYSINYAEKFNKLVSSFQGGQVIFTEPQMPIQCGGAPQQILFLTEERLRKTPKPTSISMYKAGTVVFGVPKYSAALAEIHKKQKTNMVFLQQLVEVKGKQRIAVFENPETKERQEVKFDLLHLVPPQIAPSFIKESGLSDANGYVDINPLTLQHQKFQNVWALGDSSNLPTSKTAAAIMTQTPVLVRNVVNTWRDQTSIEQNDKYCGYTSCPIFVGDKKLMLAEFLYNNVPSETFTQRQDTPFTWAYYLQTKLFPFVYWHIIPRGLWHGRKGILPALIGS